MLASASNVALKQIAYKLTPHDSRKLSQTKRAAIHVGVLVAASEQQFATLLLVQPWLKEKVPHRRAGSPENLAMCAHVPDMLLPIKSKRWPTAANVDRRCALSYHSDKEQRDPQTNICVSIEVHCNSQILVSTCMASNRH